MAALQVKQICMYLELADLPKIINTKLDQGGYRLTQTLVFPKFSYYRNTWCLNLLRNIMMESAVTARSLCQKAKTITQIRPNDQNKSKRMAQAKGSNFGTYNCK